MTKVYGHPQSLFKQPAQKKLRFVVALLCGLLIATHGLTVILRQTPPLLVNQSKF